MCVNCKCITDRERLSLVLSKLPSGHFVRFGFEITDKYVDVIVWQWHDGKSARTSSFDLQTGEYVTDTFH